MVCGCTQKGAGMHELKIVRERREGYGSLKRFRSSVDVYAAFKERFAQVDREEFLVLVLDAKNAVLGFNLVSVGTLTSSLVHPREVFKPAILGNAAALILLHNHPSGDPAPSAEDLHITRRLREVGEVFDIKVLDHIIVGDGRYVSLVDDGYWDK
jgi:DNA repair protein RadC